MAITAGELRVLLVAKDQMSSVLDKVQGNMDKAKKSGLNLGKMLKGIGGAAAIGAGAIVGLGGAMVKLAIDAAPIAAVRGAFAGIADDAPMMLRSLQRGSAGMVKQADLMKSYNSAAQLVSKTFADQLPDAMGYLGKVAGATGEDMGFMIDSLVKGVGRMSPMILDNLGLQVTLADAVARAAEMFGVEASELSKAQQQAGMMDVVMQQLAVNTAAMPDVVGSLNQQLATLPVMFADAKQMAGEALMPALSAIAEVGLPIVRDALESLQPKLEAFGKWLAEKIPLAIEKAREFLDRAKEGFNTLRDTIADFAEKAGAVLAPYAEKVQEVFGIVQEWLGTNIPLAIDAAKEAFAIVQEWLSVNIPLAVATAQEAFESIWKFIQDNVVPWFQTNIPVAIEAAKEAFSAISTYMTGTVVPALEAVWKFIQDNIKPILAGLAVILLTVVVPAIYGFVAAAVTGMATAVAAFVAVAAPIAAIMLAVGLLYKAWENDWGGMQTKLTAFWNDTGKPIFELVKTWLEVNIPLAIEAAKKFFVDTLIPAMEAVWSYIQDSFIPTFKLIVEWLQTNIPLAIEALKKFWVDVLLPAMEDVWKFVQNDLVPLFDALAKLFNVVLTLSIESLTGLWQNVLQPALEDVWGFIEKNLIPIFKTLGEKIDTFKTKTVDPLVTGIGGISGAIQGVIEWIGKMTEKLSKIKVPKIFRPGSPSPFEMSLRGISDAGAEVVKFLGNMDKAVPDHEKFSKLAASFNQLFGGISGTIKSGAGIVGGIAEFKARFAELGMGLSDISAIVTDTILPVVKAIQGAFSKGLEILGSDEEGKDSVAGSLKIWGQRMQGIASILSAVNNAVKTLSTKSDAFKTGAAKGLIAIRDAVTRNIIPVVRGIHAAFKNLPLLDKDEVIAASLAIWAKRYQAIATILGAVDKAVNMLEGKSDSFKAGAAKGLIAIRDAITTNVIPVVRGIHAAFKNLPLLDDEEVISESLTIWAKRYQGIASILGAVNTAVEMLTNKSSKFKSGAAKGLIAIRDAITKNVIPVVQGLHAAFKKLPLLDPTEKISASLKIWAERYGAISSILDGVNKAVEMLIGKSDKFKSAAAKGLIIIRDAILKNVIPVVRGIHAAFKELPLLDTDEVIADSLKIWGERYGAIGSILDGVNSAVEMLTNKSDKFKSAAAKGLIAIRDAITENVVPVIRGIHAALKNLPILDEEEVISKSLAIWADRLAAGVGIVTDTMAIATAVLDTYVSPDMSKVKTIADDAILVVQEVADAIAGFVASGGTLAAKMKDILDVKTMIGDVKATITDTIAVAQGLTEMSWRVVSKENVDSFTLNLANIVKWLTDPTSGIAAIKNLSDMSAYAVAAGNLGSIVTEVVEAVREVMTLPAIWDNRLATISEGLADFLTQVANAILTVGPSIVEAWGTLAHLAIVEFARVFNAAAPSLGQSIMAGMAAVLNDGVWSQLGARNASAYEAGWKSALGIASPSRVGMEIGARFKEGFDIGARGGDTTKSYNLYVTSSQPTVDLVNNFKMLEALG